MMAGGKCTDLLSRYQTVPRNKIFHPWGNLDQQRGFRLSGPDYQDGHGHDPDGRAARLLLHAENPGMPDPVAPALHGDTDPAKAMPNPSTGEDAALPVQREAPIVNLS